VIVQPLAAHGALGGGHPEAATRVSETLRKLEVKTLAQHTSGMSQTLRLMPRTIQHAHQQILNITKATRHIVGVHNQLHQVVQIDVLRGLVQQRFGDGL